MIHFKNLKQGTSFIEMMVALTLLAIFGSSIFLVQSNIFSKIFKVHQTVEFSQDVTQELMQLKTKIQQTILQKKNIETVGLHNVKKNPDRKIDIILEKITERSVLYNTFKKNIRIVKSSIIYENNYTAIWITFLYIPSILQKTKQQNVDGIISTNQISLQSNPSTITKGIIA